MDLSMDMLTEIDTDAMMATDGSIEGLFASLAGRPSRPSVFLRDEFSGLLESMVKKDYYAGMAEMFTKLYDGKFQKKILRRETVEVRDPVLLIFAGGIKERILQLLTHEHIMSGFLPRFIFITAESDIARLKPLGPPTDNTSSKRVELMNRMSQLHTFYTSPQMVTVNGKVLPMPAKWEAVLDTPTWNLYNHYETEMTKAALATDERDLYMPMFDRLSKSGLKCAVLLAALRGEEQIVVTEGDLMKAFSYVEYWRTCAMEVISNVGRTSSERILQQIMKHIAREDGVTRSLVMQRFHLNSRDAETILMTLEQRGMVNRVKAGRTERLYPISIGTST
jgi:predicted transcriptional regulator